ncbi:MAG: 3-deoxy-7-phosphoheptulonate synthase, partial [Planctomycetes bacterium]|nr:3-deoxy-7-phosphoheptulonate synthase [Planctomycetota bacterium]
MDPATRDQLVACLRREGLDGQLSVSGLERGARTIEVELSRPDPDLAARAALWPGVLQVVAKESVTPLASAAPDTVRVAPVRSTSPEITIGPDSFVWVAGPCAVEDPETLARAAQVVRSAGGVLFRAGAYKPRTSPYS